MFNLQSFKEPLCIIFSIILGLFIGFYTDIEIFSAKLVEYFLIALLYILFLSIDIQKIANALTYIRYTGASICINFLISPCIAYFLGYIFFADNFAIRIGLLMLLVTPCTDWYLVFTRLTKGNVEINISLLPINLALQVILLPFYLYFFFDSSINIEISSLLYSIVFVLGIPFIFAMLTRKFIEKKSSLKNFFETESERLQLIFLCLAVCIMFICEGGVLIDNYPILLKLFIPLIIFFIFTYYIVVFISKILDFNKPDTIALHFTTLARNSPLVLALAVASFPAEPLIALSLIIAPLIELPVLSFVSSILMAKSIK